MIVELQAYREDKPLKPSYTDPTVMFDGYILDRLELKASIGSAKDCDELIKLLKVHREGFTIPHRIKEGSLE